MIIPSCFELRLTAADIMLFSTISCDSGFVYDSRASTFAVNRARVTRAVARFVRFCVIALLEEIFIVTRNDGMHIRETTITNFNGVAIEDFVIFAIGGEVLINQRQECFTDVSADCCVERGVEV